MERELGHAVLASEARRQVYRLVCEEPGISVSDLAKRLGLFWTGVHLHVQYLVRAGLICSVKIGRRRVLYSADPLESASALARGLLGEPPCRRVAMAVADNPGERIYELSSRLEMSERAVYHHVKRLVAAGLLANPTGRGYRGLHPTPQLLQLLGRE